MPSRPNVLAYASPTTSRFLVFLAALLTAGAFVGMWLHNEVVGDEWTKTVVRCIGSASADPDAQGALARNAAEERCRAAAERRRSAYSFAGAGGVLVLGVCVALLAPGVLERRRRLRRAGPRLADAERRLAELAREVGLRRPPIVMVTPASRSDAFAYGFPGSYRVALPPAVAVRWRDTTLFDPLVRHELAHVEHRDVALAWLARSVWYVIAPLLALPIVAGALEGDLSLLPDYLWRAALLALTVQLVSAALLRSREHDADLRAAQAGGSVEAVAGVLDRLPDHSARWRALARHPRPASRKAVLERPQLTARVTFIDGVTAAFLAALSIPLIVTAITSLLIGSGHLERASGRGGRHRRPVDRRLSGTRPLPRGACAARRGRPRRVGSGSARGRARARSRPRRIARAHWCRRRRARAAALAPADRAPRRGRNGARRRRR